jgi:hypothetical protein
LPYLLDDFSSNSGDAKVIGIGLDWRNLPGNILGFFAARQFWRTHVRQPMQNPAGSARGSRGVSKAPLGE